MTAAAAPGIKRDCRTLERRGTPALGELVRSGFWFCARCERILHAVPADLDTEHVRCPHCKHTATTHWVPGIGHQPA